MVSPKKSQRPPLSSDWLHEFYAFFFVSSHQRLYPTLVFMTEEFLNPVLINCAPVDVMLQADPGVFWNSY